MADLMSQLAGLAGEGTRAEAEALIRQADLPQKMSDDIATAKAEAIAESSQIGSFVAGDGPQIFTTATVPVSGVLLSANLRGLSGIPTNAKGVFLSISAAAQSSEKYVYVDASGAPEGALASPKFLTHGTDFRVAQLSVPLGTDGKIQLSINATSTVTGVDAWVTGWWT